MPGKKLDSSQRKQRDILKAKVLKGVQDATATIEKTYEELFSEIGDDILNLPYEEVHEAIQNGDPEMEALLKKLTCHEESEDEVTSSGYSSEVGLMDSIQCSLNPTRPSSSLGSVATVIPYATFTEPPLIQRFPEPGETLLSISGSPVTVPAFGNRSIQLSFPTADGKVVAVRPDGGLDLKKVPRLQDSLRMQILKIRDVCDLLFNATK